MSGSGVGSWRAGGTAGMVRSQRRDGASDSGHLARRMHSPPGGSLHTSMASIAACIETKLGGKCGAA